MTANPSLTLACLVVAALATIGRAHAQDDPATLASPDRVAPAGPPSTEHRSADEVSPPDDPFGDPPPEAAPAGTSASSAGSVPASTAVEPRLAAPAPTSGPPSARAVILAPAPGGIDSGIVVGVLVGVILAAGLGITIGVLASEGERVAPPTMGTLGVVVALEGRL